MKKLRLNFNMLETWLALEIVALAVAIYLNNQ
jgi:hypothetical protein